MGALGCDSIQRMKTVLILSIDKTTRDRMTKAIAEAGFEGRTEMLGSDLELLERIQELEHTPPAAVFVDLTGLLDGDRLVEWLRLSSRTRRLRIVAIGEENDALKIFRSAWGARAVLTKPLDAPAVEELVRELNLAGRKQRAARRDARRKLVEAVEQSKVLRAEQQALVRHIDLLLAELKDRKIPFKRAKRRSEGDDEARHVG
jgi:CheY-like chemotaxis protein